MFSKQFPKLFGSLHHLLQYITYKNSKDVYDSYRTVKYSRQSKKEYLWLGTFQDLEIDKLNIYYRNFLDHIEVYKYYKT